MVTKLGKLRMSDLDRQYDTERDDRDSGFLTLESGFPNS